MRRYLLVFALFGVLAAGALVSLPAFVNAEDEGTQAQQEQNYPISELGNCASREECKAYCDAGGHGTACLDYAEAHGLMPSDEIAKARALLAEHSGPGGCDGVDACRAYCSDSAHLDECTQFAASHGLIAPKGSDSESSATAKLVNAIQTSGGPGGCSSLGACKQYCEDAEHHDECAQFAKENGIPPPKATEGARGAQGPNDQNGPNSFQPSSANRPGPRGPEHPQVDEDKAMQILAQKGGPGGCTTKDACKTYCEDASHMGECLTFAEDNGLMSADEVKRAKSFANQTGPGGCRGIACKTYCEDDAHAAECLDFAQTNGLMSADDISRARTLLDQAGPGGCRGIACKTYCEDQSHADECLQFAEKNGLVSPEDAARMKDAQTMTGPGGCTGQSCESYCQDPAHEEECKKFGQEHGMQGGDGRDSSGPPSGREFQGPGGCTDEASCAAFCKNNPDTCAQFDPEHNQGGPHNGSGDDGRFMPQPGSRTGGQGDGDFHGLPPDEGGGRFQGPPGSFPGYPGNDNGSNIPDGFRDSSQSQPSSAVPPENLFASVYALFTQLFAGGR